MANIQQQKKRNRISERQRDENLRYRSTVKTLKKRVEAAVAAGDKDKLAAEHLELVRTVDKAASRGALHKNTAARKKARAARLVAGRPQPSLQRVRLYSALRSIRARWSSRSGVSLLPPLRAWSRAASRTTPSRSSSTEKFDACAKTFST